MEDYERFRKAVVQFLMNTNHKFPEVILASLTKPIAEIPNAHKPALSPYFDHIHKLQVMAWRVLVCEGWLKNISDTQKMNLN